MKWLCAALMVGILSVAAPAADAAQDSYLYTPTRGSACSNRARQHVNQWRCPGPAGFVAEYGDEGNVVGLAIWRAATRPKSPRMISWRGAGRIFGEKLEWRIRDGEPYAAILRIWRLTTDPNGNDHEREELMILKVDAAGACRIASLNARQPGSNDLARQTAAQASTMPCRDDEYHHRMH
jgi:hypothetical protein